MGCYDLTDIEWPVIAPLPPYSPCGVPRAAGGTGARGSGTRYKNSTVTARYQRATRHGEAADHTVVRLGLHVHARLQRVGLTLMGVDMKRVAPPLLQSNIVPERSGHTRQTRQGLNLLS